MWGDEIIVKLKFSANVARRVKETVWHQSQQIQDLSDGSCTLTLQVGSTRTTPWDLGWGPDVEVFFVKKIHGLPYNIMFSLYLNLSKNAK